MSKHGTLAKTSTDDPPEKQKINKICARCKARKLRCSTHYPYERCEKDGADCQLVGCLWDPCDSGDRCWAVHLGECQRLAAETGTEVSVYANPVTRMKKLATGEGLKHGETNVSGYKGERAAWMKDLWYPEEEG